MRKLPLLLCMFCLTLLCQSQSGLHISGTSTFSINANTIVSIDGMALTPLTPYTINGSNSLERNTTLTQSSTTLAINRSFLWNSIQAAFTGSINIYYDDAELNGLLESVLTLNVHDGTQWQAYITGVVRNKEPIYYRRYLMIIRPPMFYL